MPYDDAGGGSDAEDERVDSAARQTVGEQARGRQARLADFPTKAAAQAAGRKTAMRDKVEHLIHNQDGQVGERNSYGDDPRRFKG